MTQLRLLTPWVFVLYLLTMFTLSFSGVGQVGYYFDEFIHVEKLQNFLDYGLYTREVGIDANGEPFSVRGFVYVYGPVFSLIGHAVAVILGAETWGVVSVSDAAFAARHYVVGAFSIVGVLAAGWGVSLVTRSRNWGLAASSILVSIPMWTGSATYNVKDIPAATGFTLFTVGCIATVLSKDYQTRITSIGGWVTLYLGSLIFWGTRPGLWVSIALSFVVIVLVLTRIENLRDVRQIVTRLIRPASAVVASYLTLLIIYPRVFSNPAKLLYKSFSDTSDFPPRRGSFTDGTMSSSPPGWDFLPKWTAAQLPEVIFVLTIAASLVTVWIVLNRLFRSAPTSLDFAIPALIFTFIQFAAFPIAGILFNSRITSGLRQFLFILPGLAMLLAIVLFIAVEKWNLKRFRGAWPTLVGVVVASTIVTTVIQFQLFPYSANYFNPTTFSRGIEGRWEVDRYELSRSELYSTLSVSERTHCVNCGLRYYEGRHIDNPRAGTTTPLDFTQLVRMGGPLGNGDTCEPLTSVKRPYLWDQLEFVSSFKCTVLPVPIPVDSPKPTIGLTQWRRHSLWGWQTVSIFGLVSKPGQPSAFTWSIEPDAAPAGHSVTLSLALSETPTENLTLITTVNGIPGADRVLSSDAPFQLVFDSDAIVRNSPLDGIVVVEFRLVDGNGQPVDTSLTITNFVAAPR
jgi:hypothetical protein